VTETLDRLPKLPVTMVYN